MSRHSLPSGRRLALLMGITVAVLGATSTEALAAQVVTVEQKPSFNKGSTATYWVDWNFSGETSGYTYDVCYEFNNGNYTCVAKGNGSGAIADSHSFLTDGGLYAECAYLYVPQLAYSGTISCSSTTIDKNSPSAVTGIGGATQLYTNSTNMLLTLNYQDSTSPAWYQGSTFDCWSEGVATGSCLNNPGHGRQFAFDSGCSSPDTGYSASTKESWQCSYDISSFAQDGKWFYCVLEADSAVPNVRDWSSSTNTDALSNDANLSADNPSSCGYITLDRTPPSVTAHASSTTVHVGSLVNFSATATDALSGVSGNYDWSFGDNTAEDNGQSVSHTYTHTGTYEAKVKTTDGAGNTGTGTIVIHVGTGGTGSSRCKVPSLIGKTEAKASTALSTAHCALGSVTPPRHSHGTARPGHRWIKVVGSQSPAANTSEPPGTKVKITLVWKQVVS